jgi:hypothetical protein
VRAIVPILLVACGGGRVARDPAVPSAAEPPPTGAARCEQPVRGPALRVQLDDPWDMEAMGSLVALDSGDIGWRASIEADAFGYQPVVGRVSGDEEVPLGGAPVLVLDPAVTSVAFQSDGSLWQVENVADQPPKLGHRDAAGFLDTGFGANGAIRFGEVAFSAVDLAVDAVGRPLIVGGDADGYLLLRGTVDGAPDPSFNGGAPLRLAAQADLSFFPDGRILLLFGTTPFAFSVLTADGDVDPTFPATSTDLDANESVWSVLPEAEGLLVASETYDLVGDQVVGATSQLHRVLPDGTREHIVDLTVPSRPGQFFDVWHIRRDGNGYLLVVGTLDTPAESRIELGAGWAFRLRPDLTLDRCFGPNGRGFHPGVRWPSSISEPLPDGSLAVGESLARQFVVFAPGSAE